MLKIRELRHENNKTQVELAEYLGISRQVYANYENGINEPSLDTLSRLADFFECSVDYLLGREDDFGNVTVQGSAPALTSQERELLDIFRALRPEHQAQISEYARYFSERTTKNTTKGA